MPIRLSPCATAPDRQRPHLSGAVVWATVLLVAILGGLRPAQAQRPVEGRTTAPAGRVIASKPLWSELTLLQQLALQPLAPEWSSLTAAHKRKWLALSRNYEKMTPEEQNVLHSRMAGWATLTRQQRAQARLTFAEVKQIPAEERRAKWAAYQALSEEERRALAERAPAKPRGAALPARPVSAQKLFAPVPVVNGQHAPRIQLAPPRQAPSLSPSPPAVRPAPAVAPPTAIPPVPMTDQPSSVP